MTKNSLHSWMLAPLLLTSTSLLAQDLTLFESVASDAPVERPNGFQGRNEQRNLATSPTFTLVGTSRIGDKHRATLLTSSGQIVTVNTTPGSAQAIPDHAGYRLVDIGPRRVAIAGPSDSPCVAAADRGVSCDADGLSQLTLATAAPVPPISPVEAQDNTVAVDGYNDVPPDNPFAAALRAAAANEANANSTNGQPQGAPSAERFQPRRISPDQVPAGMRVVRTPFGDRLVEQ